MLTAIISKVRPLTSSCYLKQPGNQMTSPLSILTCSTSLLCSLSPDNFAYFSEKKKKKGGMGIIQGSPGRESERERERD